MNVPISDLLDLAVKGSLILGAAAILSLVLRKASAALRHLVWFVAVLGILALPLASARLSSLEVAWFPSWNEEPAPAIIVPVTPAPPLPSSDPSMAELTPPPLPFPAPTRAVISPPVAKTEPNWPAIVWATGALFCMLPYLCGLFRLWRTTRAATAVPELLPAAEHAMKRLALTRRVSVKIGADVRMPMTWGALFPVVLLPPEFSDWTERRQRIVLLHELAHVKRFDWFTQLLAGAAAAVYWFNPLAWLAARRMRIEREQACDDLVLRSGSKASDYADELLQIAEAFGGRRWNNRAAIPMARRSSLESRIRSILTDGRERRSLTRWIIAAAVVVMSGIVVPIAMLQAAEKKLTPPERANDSEKDSKLRAARDYRSWVTSATNTDTPFEQFALAQLAGIEAHASDDQELANGAMKLGLKEAVFTRQGGKIVFKTDQWTVEANSGLVDKDTGILTFQGEVTLRRKDGQIVKADQLTVKSAGEITITGNITALTRTHDRGLSDTRSPGPKTRREDLRAFVRLVMGPDEFTFEGKDVDENAIYHRLAGVNDRDLTVLELAVTTDELSWRRVNEFRNKYAMLANELGFEHASFIGVQKRATKGSPSQGRQQDAPKAIDAAGNPVDPRPTETDTASLLQRRLAELAKRRMDAMRRRFEAGAVTQEEFDEAVYAHEVAVDPNNKLHHAELKMKMLNNRVRRLKARRNAGSVADVEQAEMEQLQAEIEYLRLKDESARRAEAQKDAGKNSAAYWNSLSARFQDRVLNELLVSYHSQAARDAELRKRYLAKHPVLIESKAKLNALEQQLHERAKFLSAAAAQTTRRAPAPRETRTKAERAALLAQLKKLTGRDRWNVLAVVHEDALLSGLIAKRNTHEQTLLSIRKSLGPKHPSVLQEQESLKLLDEQLATRTAAILKGMEIEVAALAKAEPRRFTVLGWVKSAGLYELPSGAEKISLLDAIALAGGFERHANSSSIKVRRREHGKEKVYDVSAKKLAEQPEGQFHILPGDRITVPERIF